MQMFRKIKKGIEMTGQFFIDELEAIRKDSGAILILLGALLIYPLAYSIAYKNEVIRELSTIVVDLDQTSTSKQLVRMVNGTQQIHIDYTANSLDEARKKFFDLKAGGILVVPENFERDILNGRQTHVSIYADGSYFLIYRQVISGAVSSVGTFGAGVEIKKLMMEGKTYDQALEARDPVSADIHFLYNPFSGYGTFVMPGLILIILQQTLLVGIGMLGGTAKEKKRDSFMVPVALKRGGVFPILFGKAFAYLLIYLFNCVLTMVWIHHGFGYPDRSGFFPVLMLVIPFLLSVIFMGITVSVLFRRRESSIMFMVFLSPIVMFLSGISWPVSSIPRVLYVMAHLFPSTLMVPAYLRFRVMGVDFTSVRHEYLLMIAQTFFYFLTATVALYFSARHNATKMAKEPVE